MLGDALGSDSVRVAVEADGWREAVEISGRLLVEAGAAEERYVSSMLRVVEDLGPYAVIAPGVAMPHARPEDGALGVGLSLVALSEPVEFGAGENDPVDLIFGFSSPDAEAHLDLIQALADFVESPENLRALRLALTIEEALEVVSRRGRL